MPPLASPERWLHRLDGAPRFDAGAGISARSRVRCGSFPYRLPALSTLSARIGSACYNLARPARSSRLVSSLLTVSIHASPLDFECSTRTSALGELAGDHLSWTAGGPVPIPAKAGKLSCLSGTNLARKAGRPGDRNRQASGDTPESCRQGRSR